MRCHSRTKGVGQAVESAGLLTERRLSFSPLMFRQRSRYAVSIRTAVRRKTRVGYLVDPASSHMLVSKIKPCMSKHKPKNGKAANGSLQQP